MLVPSPEAEDRFQQHQTIDTTCATAIECERGKEKFWNNKFVRGALAITALTGIFTGGFAIDVRANQLIQAESSVGLEIKGDALEKENSHQANVYFDGFGKKNADILTYELGEAIQPVTDGQEWSINFDDASLNPKDIARLIIETAHERGVDTLTLIGRSAGGITAIETAVHILEDSDLTVQLIVLVLTPDSADGLQDVQRQNLDLLDVIAKVPDVKYSTPVRALGEFGLRNEVSSTKTPIENIKNAIDTAFEVKDRLDNDKLPGGWLMYDQTLAITTSDIESDFNTIAQMPKDRVRPTVVYLGTAKPGYDPIVNVEKSSNKFGEYAGEAHLPFFSYDVAGALHTQLGPAKKEYISVLADAKDPILETIDQQIAVAKYYASVNDRPGPLLR